MTLRRDPLLSARCGNVPLARSALVTTVLLAIAGPADALRRPKLRLVQPRTTGAVARVHVLLASPAPLGAYTLEGSVDPAAAEIVAVEGGSVPEFAARPVVGGPDGHGRVRLAAFQAARADGPVGRVHVATLVLERIGNVPRTRLEVRPLALVDTAGVAHEVRPRRRIVRLPRAGGTDLPLVRRVAAAAVSAAPVGAGPLACGDVTDDGRVDIGDALQVAQFTVGMRGCGEPPFVAPERCDVNPQPSADGQCDAGDALRIAQCTVGLTGCDFACGTFRCPAACGDGRVDPGEQCDPPGSPTCPSGSPGGALVGCAADCSCPVVSDCGEGDTFQDIQEHVFTPRCALATCHGSFAQGGLDLRPGAAWPELVGVPAANLVARAAGKVRVAPGDAAASFLSQKLHGALMAGEDGRMPLLGGPLDALELALIDAWIDGGAPQVGRVPAAPCLPEEAYEPAVPLAPPPGGYQIVFEGPTLQPGQEQEGCIWIRTPNPGNFDVGKWEFSLNPGTHHFAIFNHDAPGTPLLGRWNVNDFGCFSGAIFGNNISGSPQAPYFVDTYPAGVARTLEAGSILGLNAHYYNEFDVPIQMKVWINIHPYPGTPLHRAQTIVALDDTFSINVPPFTVQTHPPPGQRRARWTNTTTRPRSVIALSGHMHNRGVRFTIWSRSGTRLYESFDWAHPNIRYFDPPLVLAPGEYFDYECLYDNGVDRPVRRNASGQPTNLAFGVSAEDAMCILTGQFYAD